MATAAAGGSRSYENMLKKYTFVNQAVLNEPISDNHSRKLRDGMKDWKRFLVELGLTEDELRLIDLQEPQDTMKRLIAMRKWKKKAGPRATYATFLDTCLRTQEDELAEKMLALLNMQSEGMSPRESPRKQQNTSVRVHITSLERSFMALTRLLSNHFYNIPQEQVIDFLLNSVPEDLAQTPEYIHIMLLDDTDKLTELIHVTDFWHVDLLGLLVKEFGTEDCMEAWMAYQTELASFYAGVTVEACRMEEWEVRDWNQDNIKIIEFQLASIWDEQRTLQDLIEFKRKLQRRAGFEKHDVRLQSIGDACTMVMVTESADLGRLENIHTEFFRTNGILKVTAAGKTIYNVESPKNYKATSVIPAPFICPIIKQIMLDPHKTNCCGKHLSRAAIDVPNHEEGESPVCPICMACPMEAKPDPFVRDKIMSLKIYCPHKYEGCHWNGEIRHLKAHWSDSKAPCHYVTVSCPKLCRKQVQWYYLNQHISKCTFQQRCKTCGKRCKRGVAYCEDCLETRMPCPYKCGDNIRPRDLLAHLKQCRTLFVAHGKDETDEMEGDNSTTELSESRYAFLELAKDLFEKRLQSLEIRHHMVNNLMSLVQAYSDKRTNEELQKAKDSLKEQESTMLVRDDAIHKQMEDSRRRMDTEIKDRKKYSGVLSTINVE